MKFCDITMAYNGASGGIKTYIDEKRRYLREQSEHEHLLVIPGARDRVRRSDRTTTVTIGSPLLPGQSDYRFFLSPAKIARALEREAPDIIELGSYYTEAWAAFSYRRSRRQSGANCILGAYFHTDVARAYVASPLRAAAAGWRDNISEALATGVDKLADAAAGGAEKYIRYVFSHCDVALAASPAQAARLQEYGVDAVDVAPMGVDLRQFSPRRRSDQIRASMGADARTAVFIYAVRLCAEKRVMTVLGAFGRLPATFEAQLWLMGDGPQRAEVEAAAAADPRVRLLLYETDRGRFAAILATADVYVSAGPFETFGLSVIEAQASGLPVVGVDSGALIERVKPGMGFLGPVDDEEVLQRNFQQAYRMRSVLGRRARVHIENNFSWTRAFERLLACYARRAQLSLRGEDGAPFPGNKGLCG